MTNDQKYMIDFLRSEGLGYKKIAAQIGISENTVKSYIRRSSSEPESKKTEEIIEPAAQHTCLCCGRPVQQNPGRKEKKFCCDKCRNQYWNSHLDQVKRKAIYIFTCPSCGKTFSAYGNANRKYCSHACYVATRFGGGV